MTPRITWRQAGRGLVIWLLATFILLVFGPLVPGVQVPDFQTAALFAAAVGLANAAIRPVFIAFAVRLPVVVFLLIVFLMNAFIFMGVALLPLPIDVGIESLWSALGLSVLVGAVNGLISPLLGINDRDSYYANVVRRMVRRHPVAENATTPGLIVVQIDGLGYPAAWRALAEGRMPVLARWLALTHRMVQWECDIPSMTTASQAGILYGTNHDIPAFRWWDKDLGRLIVSNRPADATHINDTLGGTPLLSDRGSSIGNIFRGGAERTFMVMATMKNEAGQLQVGKDELALYLISPYNLTRATLQAFGDLGRELWEQLSQWFSRRQPRQKRFGAFMFVRVATTVFMRDLATFSLVEDMLRGRPVAYADYLGYDEVAHHAGPMTEDALRTLSAIDKELGKLEDALQHAGRPYEFVVVSDHGQSTGATFLQRYGVTLKDVIQGLLEGEAVGLASGSGEGFAHLNAVITEVTGGGGRVSRASQRLLRRRSVDGYIDMTPSRRREEVRGGTDVVVCPSGNLAQVYFTALPGRVTLETIRERFPGLVEGLAQHPGIGFVVARSETRGPIAIGPRGARVLESGEVEGEDPLLAFGPVAHKLARLAGFSNCGDLVVNSFYDPETDEVAAFEELIGCHGGAGGMQMRPIIVYPAHWTRQDPDLRSAGDVHRFLRAHAAAVQQDEAQASGGDGAVLPGAPTAPGAPGAPVPAAS